MSRPRKTARASKAAKRKLPADPRAILKKLSSLPIQTWNYKRDDPSTRHIGPMAQDFSRIFGVGDHRGIHLTDALGVAYASIQALNQMAKERAVKISALRRELQKIQSEIKRIHAPRRRHA